MTILNQDTRLVMTILFVGTVSGANVYFYSNYGYQLPWSAFSHAVLFGLITVGAIMGLKAMFDLAINERIELWFLDRKIRWYWEKKGRENQQRQRLREYTSQYSPVAPQPIYQQTEVSEEFLAAIEP